MNRSGGKRDKEKVSIACEHVTRLKNFGINLEQPVTVFCTSRQPDDQLDIHPVPDH